MAIAPVGSKDQPAHLVTQMIEEDHARRARSLAWDDFSIDDPRVLALFIGDDHPQLSVLFNDIDAFDVDLPESGSPALGHRDPYKRACEDEGGDDRVDL